MPIAVHGPHRASRVIVRQEPTTAPCLAITTSAYRLHVGVNRHWMPTAGISGESDCW